MRKWRRAISARSTTQSRTARWSRPVFLQKTLKKVWASCRRTEKNLFIAENTKVAEKAWPKDPRFQVPLRSLRLCGDMTCFTCRFRELEPKERFPNRPLRVFIGIGKKYGGV